MVQSSNLDIDLPQGYVWYETMIVLRPDLSEEDRCVQLRASHQLVMLLQTALNMQPIGRGHDSAGHKSDDLCCRDVELAKFEAFLKKENSQEISALVRGNQRLAYPIKGYASAPKPFLAISLTAVETETARELPRCSVGHNLRLIRWPVSQG